MRVRLSSAMMGTALLASSVALAMSDEEHRMGGIPNMPAHILKLSGTQAGHGRAGAPFGRLGDPATVSLRVQLEAFDPHTFNLGRLDAQAGQTLEIVMHNAGRSPHELVIGDRQHQAEYARIVAAMRTRGTSTTTC